MPLFCFKLVQIILESMVSCKWVESMSDFATGQYIFGHRGTVHESVRSGFKSRLSILHSPCRQKMDKGFP